MSDSWSKTSHQRKISENLFRGLYGSMVERHSCKLKVLGSIPSGACWYVCYISQTSAICQVSNLTTFAVTNRQDFTGALATLHKPSDCRVRGVRPRTSSSRKPGNWHMLLSCASILIQSCLWTDARTDNITRMRYDDQHWRPLVGRKIWNPRSNQVWKLSDVSLTGKKAISD